ncbi:MAG: hypothetical protein V8S27_03890 [Lachnospiraceae bacterium]
MTDKELRTIGTIAEAGSIQKAAARLQKIHLFKPDDPSGGRGPGYHSLYQDAGGVEADGGGRNLFKNSQGNIEVV